MISKDDINDIRLTLYDLIEELDEIENKIDYSNMILDLKNFVYNLRINNLYSDELRNFIINYIKFYN